MNFSDCFLEFADFILQIGNFFIGRFFGLIIQVFYQILCVFHKLSRRIFKAVVSGFKRRFGIFVGLLCLNHTVAQAIHCLVIGINRTFNNITASKIPSCTIAIDGAPYNVITGEVYGCSSNFLSKYSFTYKSSPIACIKQIISIHL